MVWERERQHDRAYDRSRAWSRSQAVRADRHRPCAQGREQRLTR